MLHGDLREASREVNCVTAGLAEMKSKSSANYDIPGLADMISKSIFNHDINLCLVVCTVQHRKDILQYILFDL